jgi:WD40 repeat protein
MTSSPHLELLHSWPDHAQRLGFDPQGNYLASVGQSVRLFAMPSGKEMSRIDPTPGQRIVQVVFHPTQSKLVLIEAGWFRLWDIISNQNQWLYPDAQPVSLRGVSLWDGLFSPDGTQLLTADNHALRCWDVEQRTQVGQKKTYGVSIRSLAFHAQTHWLAGGDEQGNVRFWKVKSSDFSELSSPRTRESGELSAIDSVSFSADGSHLISAGTGPLRIWDTASGQLVNSLHQHDLKFGQAVCPANNWLATAQGGHVKFWDLPSGNEYKDYRIKTNQATCLAFSADGKYLAVGDSDGTKIWRWEPPMFENESSLLCVKIFRVPRQRLFPFVED